MNSESSDEPKLIIDEDWKTQVQREKEQLKRRKSLESQDASLVDKTTGSYSADDNLTTGDQAPSTVEASEQDLQPPPPASFEFLVSGMATQAIAAMGQLPDENGPPVPVRLDYARHYIDLLGILESKTIGNLSETEQRFLQNTLHQLRMLFVSVKK